VRRGEGAAEYADVDLAQGREELPERGRVVVTRAAGLAGKPRQGDDGVSVDYRYLRQRLGYSEGEAGPAKFAQQFHPALHHRPVARGAADADHPDFRCDYDDMLDSELQRSSPAVQAGQQLAGGRQHPSLIQRAQAGLPHRIAARHRVSMSRPQRESHCGPRRPDASLPRIPNVSP
jgi:hypothetical protein